MHKRESFSQMITFEFLSKRLIKDLNLHFQENEIKTDKETVVQTSSDNYTVKKKKDVLICCLYLEPCANETMY